MTSSAHPLHGYATLYALNALSTEEAREFQAHLGECSECRSELADSALVAAQLSAVTETAPPASIRAHVLQAIHTSATATAPEAMDGVADLIAADATPSPMTPPHRRAKLPSRPWQLLAAAAAVIAIAATGWGIQQHQAATNANKATSLYAALTAADAKIGTGQITGAGAVTVAYSPSHRQLLLLANNLASPGPGKTYQAWLIHPAGVITSAGLFVPGSNGRAVFSTRAMLATGVRFAITVEPAGGSPQPTTTPSLLPL